MIYKTYERKKKKKFVFFAVLLYFKENNFQKIINWGMHSDSSIIA